MKKPCITPGCSKSAAPKHSYCYACAKAANRARYPLKAAYLNLKDNAKRRGKEFDLTFEQFQIFAAKTDYMRKKGIHSESYHIDRIDETKGYTINNIQVITNCENLRKFRKFKERINNIPNFEVCVSKPVEQVDCPY